TRPPTARRTRSTTRSLSNDAAEADHRVVTRAARDEVLDRAREGGGGEADQREVLAALARRLAGRVLAIGREALVPADDAERAVGGERRVHERHAGGARGGGEREARVGVVEAVDGETGAGEQLRR